MQILTAAEMQQTDRRTVEQCGVSSFALMRSAGAAVARFIVNEYPEARRITLFCGRGNNGGDGWVAARELELSGRTVQAFLLGKVSDLRGDAAQAYASWGGRAHELEAEEQLAATDLKRTVQESDVIVDAVVGTGFEPPLRGLAAQLRDQLAECKPPVVAVDLPSGWSADSHAPSVDGAFRADAVVTFTAPKSAHVFGLLTGSAYAPVVVAPIGSPESIIESAQRLSWAGASKRIFDTSRKADSNKGTYGHALIVAGAWGKSGAAAMASLAALRAGAGLVTTATPESILPLVAAIAPELMTLPLLAGAKGEIAAANLEPERLTALLYKKTVLALGPGIGDSPETETFVLGLLKAAQDQPGMAIVLDADALNIMARHRDKLHGTGHTLVLTPHPGEMARLAGLSIAEVQADREGLARSFAVEHQLTLVLKGWRTLIAHPDGSLAVNTTGNPGMAKGGSGDILTGILAACLAQNIAAGKAQEAVEAAVYLHGLAADLALREQSEQTLLATDTIAHLADAFRFRAQAPSTNTEGYTWLQGLPKTLRPSLFEGKTERAQFLRKQIEWKSK